MPCRNHPFVEDRLTRCSRCAEAFCPDCVVEIGGLPYCSDCKTESMRDLLSGVPSRELDMASVGRRLVALLIDGMIVLVPCIGLAFAVIISIGFLDEAEAALLGGFAQILISLFLWLAYFLYEGLMLGSGGQTVGKKALSIKVVTAEGGKITPGQAWGRSVSRLIIGMFCWPIDYLVAFGQERTTIHDMMAKTRVVNWE
jgi:uncharacterized RDD family membrane protein YckC